jgi:hypothetical protein
MVAIWVPGLCWDGESEEGLVNRQRFVGRAEWMANKRRRIYREERKKKKENRIEGRSEHLLRVTGWVWGELMIASGLEAGVVFFSSYIADQSVISQVTTPGQA